MMTAPRLLLLDNVDSFTFMLVDYLRVAGAEVRVERNDALDVAAALDGADGIVISPGPGDARRGRDFGRACRGLHRPSSSPLLGVCLGHQAIAWRAAARSGASRRCTARSPRAP